MKSKDCLEVSTNVRYALCIENELKNTKRKKKHQYGHCRYLYVILLLFIFVVQTFSKLHLNTQPAFCDRVCPAVIIVYVKTHLNIRAMLEIPVTTPLSHSRFTI